MYKSFPQGPKLESKRNDQQTKTRNHSTRNPKTYVGWVGGKSHAAIPHRTGEASENYHAHAGYHADDLIISLLIGQPLIAMSPGGPLRVNGRPLSNESPDRLFLLYTHLYTQ